MLEKPNSQSHPWIKEYRMWNQYKYRIRSVSVWADTKAQVSVITFGLEKLVDCHKRKIRRVFLIVIRDNFDDYLKVSTEDSSTTYKQIVVEFGSAPHAPNMMILGDSDQHQ